MYTFSAVIDKIGINPYVDVPKKISDAFGKKGYVYVKGKINDFSFSATLVPLGDSMHRLYINGIMRKGANADVGDKVDISLSLDKSDRILQTPKELSIVLKKNKLLDRFENLTPSRRKEMIRYLTSLKSKEAKERTIVKIINILKDKEKWFGMGV